MGLWATASASASTSPPAATATFAARRPDGRPLTAISSIITTASRDQRRWPLRAPRSPAPLSSTSEKGSNVALSEPIHARCPMLGRHHSARSGGRGRLLQRPLWMGFRGIMPPDSADKYFVASLRAGDVAAVGSQLEGVPPTGVWTRGVESADEAASRGGPDLQADRLPPGEVLQLDLLGLRAPGAGGTRSDARRVGDALKVLVIARDDESGSPELFQGAE